MWSIKQHGGWPWTFYLWPPSSQSAINQNIESIDSTMKPFSTVTMKGTLRYLEDDIWYVIVYRATYLWMSLKLIIGYRLSRIPTQEWRPIGLTRSLSCKTEFLVVVCMKVTLSRRLFTFQENFLEELLKKCKFTTENIVAVVSNTAISMNKFGTLLEKLDIPQIYCTYHVLQITAKNA